MTKQERIHTTNVSRRKILGVAAIIAFFSIVSFGIANADIETVSVPFPGPYDSDCSYTVGKYLMFNCYWRSLQIPADIQKAIQEWEDRIDIVPPEEIVAAKERIITEWITTPPFVPEPEPEPPLPTVADVLKEKLDPGVLAAVNKLGECERGFEGWAAFQERSVYEVPDQFIWIHGQIRNDIIVKDLNMAYEECRIQRDYPLSAVYENKILADILGLDRFGREQTHTFNQTTNFERYYYEPLTQEDFDEAERIAEEFKCSEAGTALGHCITERTDVNRGNPNPIIKNLDAYNQFLNFKAGQIQTEQDYQDTIAEAKEAQCDVHYPIYKHRARIGDSPGGSELPAWLEHCETVEDEFARTGIICAVGGERVLCSEMKQMQLERDRLD